MGIDLALDPRSSVFYTLSVVPSILYACHCHHASRVHEVSVTECAHSCVASRFGLRQAKLPLRHMRADLEGAQREFAALATTSFCVIFRLFVFELSATSRPTPGHWWGPAVV